MLIVFLLRILTSLIILRAPLYGGLIAICIDYLDLNILTSLRYTDNSYYQSVDKIADIFYLSLEAYIVLFWKNKLAKSITLFAFIYRLIGVLIFELTQREIFLVIFPNVFEYIFLIYLLTSRLFKRDIFVKIVPLTFLVLSLIFFKTFHEYLLHINTTHPWTNNYYVKKVLDPDSITTFAK